MTDTEHAALANPFEVRGRRIFITGAASGLGEAMVTVLAQHGAEVVAIDATKGPLDKLCDKAGDSVVGHVVDVRDEVALTAVLNDSRPDVVFANAGVARGAGLADPDWQLESFPRDAWDYVMDVNLDGVLNTMRAAAGHMRPRGSGKIVVTASTAGLRADPMVSYAYVASKSAVINLVRQASLDLAPAGVTVNAIAPGPFSTNIGGERGRDERVARAWADSVPLGRKGDTKEIHGVVLLLASDASSFMTGSVIPVDGGALARSHA